METIKLQYPISAEGNTVTEIKLRRPKVADLRKMGMRTKDEIGQSLALISDLAELPPEAIDDLDAADYKVVGEVIGRFFN